jgi:hypothetical protein
MVGSRDEIRNFRRMCVVALQRSGHHAIINWIMKNINGKTYLLNHSVPATNPFITYTKPGSILHNLNIENEIAGIHEYKKQLIYNYEDRLLSEIFFSDYENIMKGWVGRSQFVFNIIVLRDPFNNFASKYKWALSGIKWPPSPESIKQLPTLWKSYAREFVGATSYIHKENKILINYNRWFSDLEYRSSIAQILLLESTEKGIEEVAKWGPATWGDSFDNMTYDGKAGQMDVLNRWQNYKDDEVFRSLFKDAELLELSEKIFGHMPGTEAFI